MQRAGGHLYHYATTDVPNTATDTFDRLSKTLVYYLPSASDWASTLNGLTTEKWLPLLQNLREEDGVFTFDVEWANGRQLTTQYSLELGESTEWNNICNRTVSFGTCTMQDANWITRSTAFYRVIE